MPCRNIKVHYFAGSVYHVLSNSASTFIAIGLALASTLAIAWGTVIRHRIAARAESSILRTAMSNPWWWAGTATAIGAYALQLVALAFGTLLVVQPVLTLSLMFTLLLSAAMAHKRMSSRAVTWSIFLTVSVGFVVAYGRPLPGGANPSWHQWWPALTAGGVVMLLLILTAMTRPELRALNLGAACGVLYGYVALLSKSVAELGTAAPTHWTLYALLALAGAGSILQQYSFHAGPLEHSLPAMTILEPLVAFALGYAVLKEQFQVHTAWGWVAMACAIAMMIAATVVLSREPIKQPLRPTAAQARPDSLADAASTHAAES